MYPCCARETLSPGCSLSSYLVCYLPSCSPVYRRCRCPNVRGWRDGTHQRGWNQKRRGHVGGMIVEFMPVLTSVWPNCSWILVQQTMHCTVQACVFLAYQFAHQETNESNVLHQRSTSILHALFAPLCTPSGPVAPIHSHPVGHPAIVLGNNAGWCFIGIRLDSLGQSTLEPEQTTPP